MCKNRTFILLFALPYLVITLFLGITYEIYGITQGLIEQLYMLIFIIPLSITPLFIYILVSLAKISKKNIIPNGRFIEGKLVSVKPIAKYLTVFSFYNIEISLYNIKDDTVAKDIKIPKHLTHRLKVNKIYKIHQSYDNPFVFNIYLDDQNYL